MNLQIRRMGDDDVEELVRLALLAWAPVFASFEAILGSAIYAALYPDWHAAQRAAVVGVCAEPEHTAVWVAEADGTIAGFIAYELNPVDLAGEVTLLAVAPAFHNQGIGTALNEAALDRMRAGGMRLAVAATGGDPSHAPARRSYEKAGYVGLPLVRFYKDLEKEHGLASA